MSELQLNKTEFIASYALSSQLPASERPEFVFSGRSNVGKSSLINKLACRKRLARVSSTPGKTATINFYSAGDAYLVDLPGYGYAKTSDSERRRWDKLINDYFGQHRDVRLLVQLLDCRHAPSKDDVNMLLYLQHHNIPFIAVLTKADKLKKMQQQQATEEFTEYLSQFESCEGVFLTSAEKNMGIEELAKALEEAMPE